MSTTSTGTTATNTVGATTGATTPGAKLNTSFTTFWGDTLNGLWVSWSHDVTAPGARTMGITLTANLYAASLTNFMFG